jgi:hypothetical protein
MEWRISDRPLAVETVASLWLLGRRLLGVLRKRLFPDQLSRMWQDLALTGAMVGMRFAS